MGETREMGEGVRERSVGSVGRKSCLPTVSCYIVAFGRKTKIPGIWRCCDRCSAKCTGIDARLLVTEIKFNPSCNSQTSVKNVKIRH